MAAPPRVSGERQEGPLLLALALLLLAGLGGCASPGAPRAPSLDLPRPVTDLAVTRSGDLVDLQFTTPRESSDSLPLRSQVVHASVCLQATPHGVCTPVDPAQRLTSAQGGLDPLRPGQPVHWQDRLPAALRQGPPRPIAYRLELRNQANRSAGLSAPVYALAGTAPAPVSGLVAEGTRRGVLLQWSSASPQPESAQPESPQPQTMPTGQVLLQREQIHPLPGTTPKAASSTTASPAARAPFKSRKGTGAQAPKRPEEVQDPGSVRLNAEPGPANLGRVLDGSVVEGVTYRYTAFRRLVVPLNGRTLELLSAGSTPLEVVWRDVYPPPVPANLTALGFASPAPSGGGSGAYAVDLVWEPVVDARLAGYLVRRTPLSASGQPAGAAVSLTPEPIPTPAFHDSTAQRTGSYRYEVMAIDGRGNQSTAASATVRAAQP